MISRVLLQTLVTGDLDEALTAWTGVLGWQVMAEGETDGALAGFWGVEPKSYGRFALVNSPGSERGFVRLLEGPEGDRRGTFCHRGLLNAEFLCRDVDELHRHLRESSSFRPVCDPTTYDLGSTGGAVSRSFATRGPGGSGVFFTTYISVPPPRKLPTCEHLVGPMFNSAVAVEQGKDVAAFYEGILGMARRLEGRIVSPSINRILDLPDDWGFHLVVFKGEGEGLIEVDVHEHDLPREHNRGDGRLEPGNSFLTLEAADFDGIMEGAERRGVVQSAPTSLPVPPYGGRRAALLRGPAGELLEVVEAG